ncbi:hypothetical protein ACFX13_043671 [Malus domestica]
MFFSSICSARTLLLSSSTIAPILSKTAAAASGSLGSGCEFLGDQLSRSSHGSCFMLSLPSRLPSLWLEKLQTAMVVVLDADMIIHGPIAPWELTAEKGKAYCSVCREYYCYYFSPSSDEHCFAIAFCILIFLSV